MKKADFIIISVVAVIVCVLLFFLYVINGNDGKYVQVEIDGKVADTIPLNEDIEKVYETDDNATNTLVIKDGTAVISDANCPDGICSNHMPIKRSGESIICLPHKLVVSVVDKLSDDADIDAVA
ncbi:MAG: NusG domain II-containing protein [Acetobacter sp.]|nr:NusG domain II-containing protein [Bacteroides sp.]MCM1341234.1 NusG domain II-containing protein [Acetobacter sp.]MCM1433877.1 NusG domain II-containing protein [Clostridiales bacterium]